MVGSDSADFFEYDLIQLRSPILPRLSCGASAKVAICEFYELQIRFTSKILEVKLSVMLKLFNSYYYSFEIFLRF